MLFASSLIIKPKSISHRSIINDIEIVGDKVYTVSNDNTIKVWSKTFLDLKNTVYEKSGENYANLYTLAQNGNYILTGGITGTQNSVFVHDKKSLKVVKLLQHDFSVLSRLRFNPKNKMLVIASGDELYFYDKDLKFIDKKSFYKYSDKYPQSIYDVIFLNTSSVVFVNWDGYVVLYDFKKRKVLASSHIDTRLQALDFVDGKIYVGAYDGYLYVYDTNLKQINKIFIASDFTAINIAHDKDKMAVAGGSGGFAVIKNDKVLFKKDVGFVKAIEISGDDIYVGNYNILQKYHLDKLKEQTKEHILKPKNISFNSKYFYLNYQSIYDNFVGYHSDYKSHMIDGEKYSYKVAGATLAVLKNDQIIQIHTRDAASGYRHRKVLWYKHYLISGGDYGHVYLYDVKNKDELYMLQGLKDHIIDMALNQDMLAVATQTGDIHLFNLLQLKNNPKPYATITLFNDLSFLIRSESYFYSNNPNNVVCLKSTRLNLIKTKCKPNKKIFKQILKTQKPYEEDTIKKIDLRSNTPLQKENQIVIYKLFVNKNYVVTKSEYELYIYRKKDLKLLKKFYLGWDKVYQVSDDAIYIKGIENKNYKIDLKTLKKFKIKKLPPKKFTQQKVHFSRIDSFIYYKSYSTKAKEPYVEVYETDKYIVAIGQNRVYVYDKKLNLLGEITLDKRVQSVYCTKNGNLYYAIYDKIFKYNIGF